MTIPFNEEDVQQTLRRSLLMVAIAVLLAAPILGFWVGWQTWLLFVVGAAVSASGVYEWMRMLSAVMARMDAGRAPRPMARVLFMFFLRMALAGWLLYVSLRSLNGSVYALFAGLAMSLLAVSGGSIRLMARVPPPAVDKGI